jgi:hypothetical protein
MSEMVLNLFVVCYLNRFFFCKYNNLFTGLVPSHILSLLKECFPNEIEELRNVLDAGGTFDEMLTLGGKSKEEKRNLRRALTNKWVLQNNPAPRSKQEHEELKKEMRLLFERRGFLELINDPVKANKIQSMRLMLYRKLRKSKERKKKKMEGNENDDDVNNDNQRRQTSDRGGEEEIIMESLDDALTPVSLPVPDAGEKEKGRGTGSSFVREKKSKKIKDKKKRGKKKSRRGSDNEGSSDGSVENLFDV